MNSFLSFLSKQKTILFLIMCLMVHVFNALLFSFIGIFPLAILNVFSSLYYTFVLFLFKQNKDSYVIFSYFEIIMFSFVSDLFTGGLFCYIYFVIGMISVVIYLLPPEKHMKHVYQIIGIVFALAIYYVSVNKICFFPQYSHLYEFFQNKIRFLNLCITLFTLFYISNLYIFDMNAANEKLNYTSNHDLLTGLFNRRFFEHIMNRNKTENESKFTIALFDIDDFKKVNDVYGHHAGDLVLKTLSDIIEDCSKNDYVPVRWGGEEFILYMPQTDDGKAYEYIFTLCERIRNTVVEFEGTKIQITVTVGMCTGSDLTDYEAIIRKADERLYTGKRNGKNCIVR